MTCGFQIASILCTTVAIKERMALSAALPHIVQELLPSFPSLLFCSSQSTKTPFLAHWHSAAFSAMQVTRIVSHVKERLRLLPSKDRNGSERDASSTAANQTCCTLQNKQPFPFSRSLACLLSLSPRRLVSFLPVLIPQAECEYRSCTACACSKTTRPKKSSDLLVTATD